MHKYKAKSYEALLSITNEIRLRCHAKPLLFRGQVNRHKSMLPSALRGDNDKFQNLGWNQAAEYMSDDFSRLEKLSNFKEYSKEQKNSIISIVLQHYAYRSYFLDLTENLQVSLYFAKNKYNQQRKFYFFKYEDRTNLEDNVVFLEDTNKSPNYIYVFVADESPFNENLSTFSVIKLETLFSSIPSRFASQKAWMMYFSPDTDPKSKGALTRCVAEIELAFPYKDVPESDRLSFDELFPSYEADIFYNSILSIPFVKASPSFDFFKRAISTPLYFSGEKALQSGIKALHDKTGNYPKFTYPYFNHIAAFLRDHETPPVIVAEKKDFSYLTAEVFKLLTTMATFNKLIKRKEYAYTFATFAFDMYYTQLLNPNNENSFLFEFCDLDLYAIKNMFHFSESLVLFGVWGAYAQGKLYVRGLYAGDDQQSGEGGFGLTQTFVIAMNRHVTEWQVEEAIYRDRSSRELVRQSNLSSEENARAINIAGIWYGYIILYITGKFTIAYELGEFHRYIRGMPAEASRIPFSIRKSIVDYKFLGLVDNNLLFT